MTELSGLTTLGVGGPARSIIEPATRDELVSAVLDAWGSAENWLLLGGGSNVVIADEGFDGTVIRIATRGVERLPESAPRSGRTFTTAGAGPRTLRLRVEAGEPWDTVVASAVEEGWAGIEALSGIPGSAGAAPVQNIGAYGQELASSLVGVDFLDYASGEQTRLSAAELGLGYRTSALKRDRPGAVLAVELELDAPENGARPLSQPIAYAQLAERLGVPLGSRVPLAELRAAVLELRAGKGMLLDGADPDSRSAGSFFTNPIVTEHFARGLPSDAPRWPTAPEEPPRLLRPGAAAPPLAQPASGEYLVKLSAAWLIERAGIRRGFSLPGSRAAISSRHALAIVNCGGATAEEIVQLATFVQTRVLSEFGVMLQPEPVLVGVSL